MKSNIAAILLFSTFFLINCANEDPDTKAPEISIIRPDLNDTFAPGEAIRFSADFDDNVALRSYKIEIHAAFDDHSHGRTAHGEGVEWNFSGSWNFDAGQSQANTDHSEIMVPATIDGEPVAHGTYHFGVFCSDDAGNESSDLVEIIIEDGEFPQDE